jgi:hypothetical protein
MTRRSLTMEHPIQGVLAKLSAAEWIPVTVARVLTGVFFCISLRAEWNSTHSAVLREPGPMREPPGSIARRFDSHGCITRQLEVDGV